MAGCGEPGVLGFVKWISNDGGRFFFFFFDRNFAAAKTIKLVKTGFVPGKVFWLRIVFIFVRFVVELNVKAWKLG